MSTRATSVGKRLKPWRLVITLLTAYMLWQTAHAALIALRLREQANALQRQISVISAENKTMERQAANLRSVAFLRSEEEIQLNQAKPGTVQFLDVHNP